MINYRCDEHGDRRGRKPRKISESHGGRGDGKRHRGYLDRRRRQDVDARLAAAVDAISPSRESFHTLVVGALRRRRPVRARIRSATRHETIPQMIGRDQIALDARPVKRRFAVSSAAEVPSCGCCCAAQPMAARLDEFLSRAVPPIAPSAGQ